MTTTPTIDPESLLAVAERPLDWLWPNRIPLGKITLLAGDPGLGKSMFALDLAARLSRGLPFPDAPVPPSLDVERSTLNVGRSSHSSNAPIPSQSTTQQFSNSTIPPSPNGSMTRSPAGPISALLASTILLSAEDDPADTIRPRLEAAGADLSRIKLPHPTGKIQAFSPFALCDPDNLDVIRLAILGQDHCRLLIIDPISAYLGNTNAASNEAVRHALMPLAQLATEYNVAILAITHLRKSGAQRAICRAMDSLAFAATARSVWFVTADPGDRARRLWCAAKSNLGADPSALAFRIQDNHLLWEADPLPLTAEEALALCRPNPEIATERRQAMAWLTEILNQAALPADDVTDHARKLGFTGITLRRAREALGILTTRRGFGPLGTWFWHLPNGPAPAEPPAPRRAYSVRFSDLLSQSASGPAYPLPQA